MVRGFLFSGKNRGLSGIVSVARRPQAVGLLPEKLPAPVNKASIQILKGGAIEIFKVKMGRLSLLP